MQTGPLIAINAVALGVGGGLHYLNFLFAGLRERKGTERYLIFASQGVAERLYGADRRFAVQAVPRMSTPQRLLWEQLTLPRLAAQAGASVLLSTANIAPLRLPSGLRSVVVVQNMAPFLPFHHYRLWRNQVRFRLLRRLTLASLRRASRVISVGGHTLKVLRQHVPLPPDKCAVVHLGRGKGFAPMPREAATARVAAEFGLGRNYVLYVSHIYEYKNMRELVQAFGRLASRYPDLDLVIAGGFYDGPYIEQTRRLAAELGIGERVHWLGHVAHAQLPALYNACHLFAFPSAVETNSLILIEAMACGCLIAASKSSVMPEVCGDAALYFEPFDPADIAATLERVLALPPEEAESLRKQAMARAATYSWDSMIDGTLAVLRELVAADERFRP